MTEIPVGNCAEALWCGEPWGGAPDCQPLEQACQRGGISKILKMTAKAAATIAAMELFYTRMEPWCRSLGTWEALPLFRRKARFYS